MKKILFAALALIVVMASCVKDPQYPGVTITNVTYLPTAVQADVPVTVSATITSFNTFTATLVYTVNEGEPVTVEMTGETDKDVFTAVIPGFADDTKVSFYVQAEGELTAKSGVMEYIVGAVAIDYSVLRLNELNGNDKFIEIYNGGAEAINMNGVAIYKDTEKLIWTGKVAVSVEPGGYLLLYSEDVVADHPEIDTTLYKFNSGLSAKKNVRIELKTPAGETFDDFNLVDIDQNDPSMIPAPGSYSRNADGQWYYADATPGAVNVEGTVQVMGLEGGPEGPNYKNLILNELNGDSKFIEIYNKGNLDLPMDGMYIEKDDKIEPIWVSDGSITVPAHGYVVLYSEDVVADHPELEGTNYIFGSGLSAKKALRIALFMGDGTERDLFTRCPEGAAWGDALSNVAPQSYARTPDGGDWKLADPTPGAANPETGEDIPLE